uniref:Vesicle transport protein n=1 Tax=Neogobius melanostomus TaxID=47308 RepID=A0A8C6T7P9_9GOBI
MLAPLAPVLAPLASVSSPLAPPLASAVMAELNRQLQQYLAQSKAGRSAVPSASSTALDLGTWGRGAGLTGLVRPLVQSLQAAAGGSELRRVLLALVLRPGPVFRRPESGAASRGLCRVLALLRPVLRALGALRSAAAAYARKFALLWSLGSVFAIAAVATLRGPVKLLYGLPTSPAAAAYLTALSGTLYAALSLQSTALTALGAAVQVAVILGAVVSLLPGGAAGMRFMGGLAASALKRSVRAEPCPSEGRGHAHLSERCGS